MNNSFNGYSKIIECNFFYIFVILITFALTFGITNNVHAAENEYQLPNWIRTIAIWWGEDKINDQDFINTLQYLVENDLLVIPEQELLESQCGPGLSLNSTSNECEIHDKSETTGIFPEGVDEHQKVVVSWIKLTTLWWGQEKIADQDFINVLQYLVENNILSKETNAPTISKIKQEFKPEELIVWPKINKIEDFKIQGHGNTETYYLQFKLLDNRLKPVSADGTISIVIMDDRNRILFLDAFSVRKANYVESVNPFVVEHNDGGEKLYSWQIKTSEILKGFTPYGKAKLVFTDRYGNNFKSEMNNISIPTFSK